MNSRWPGGDKRIRIENEVDRITELPVNLREHILDRLSIKDAVATSLLSSQWRYCWTGLRRSINLVPRRGPDDNLGVCQGY